MELSRIRNASVRSLDFDQPAGESLISPQANNKLETAFGKRHVNMELSSEILIDSSVTPALVADPDISCQTSSF